jgi:hypothetical protein
MRKDKEGGWLYHGERHENFHACRYAVIKDLCERMKKAGRIR